MQRIDGLVKHMDAETLNGQVFEVTLSHFPFRNVSLIPSLPPFCQFCQALNAGFGDTQKLLRELTLKSMLSLAPKLNNLNINDRLMRTLAKLQVCASILLKSSKR